MAEALRGRSGVVGRRPDRRRRQRPSSASCRRVRLPGQSRVLGPAAAAHSLVRSRREGPGDPMFGRLAPGVTLEEAQAELAAIGAAHGRRLPGDARAPASTRREVHRAVRRRRGRPSSVHWSQFIFVMLLLVLSSNVATMVFARTATREHEIAMRFALGSSRGRILGQFFVEALVLALAAAAVGLARGLRQRLGDASAVGRHRRADPVLARERRLPSVHDGALRSRPRRGRARASSPAWCRRSRPPGRDCRQPATRPRDGRFSADVSAASGER